MFKKVMFFTAILFLFSSGAPAMEVAGLNIPDTMQLEEDAGKLVLNGAGIRKKFTFKVYVGGLYLTEKTSDSGKIINSDEPMAITMNWLRTGPIDKVTATFSEGFSYSTDGQDDALKAKIDMFLNTIVEARKSDEWKFVYTPGLGTAIYQNGQHAITVSGLAFKKALFGIWLLESDAFTGDEGLRNGMLGRE